MQRFWLLCCGRLRIHMMHHRSRVWKHKTSSTKLEVHNILQCCQRRAELWPHASCAKNLMKLSPVVSKICKWPDIHTCHNTLHLFWGNLIKSVNQMCCAVMFVYCIADYVQCDYCGRRLMSRQHSDIFHGAKTSMIGFRETSHNRQLPHRRWRCAPRCV